MTIRNIYRFFLFLFPVFADPRLWPLALAMHRFLRQMPAAYAAHPLTDYLATITPAEADLAGCDPDRVAALADALARLHRHHPFGLCMRRALLRYHFLRRVGLPLGITFGVRFRQPHEVAAGATPGLAGHAWNTLHGLPWRERAEDYQGFKEIYRVENKT